jgi:DNA repair exonuclease SbcCD nuclease subunit
LIVFSDLHLRESSEDACMKVLGAVGDLARKSDRRIVCCGDFWHIRYQVNVRLQNIVVKWLEALHALKIEIDIVPGNHDQVDVQGRNALEVFAGFPDVRVWTEPGVRNLYGFVPYRKDQAEVRRMLEAMGGPPKSHPAGLIFAHFGVGGSLMNNGTVDQSDFYVPSGLPPIVMGHYHKRQIGPPSTTPNVHPGWPAWQYVGSPYQTSFGEAGNQCGVLEIIEGVFPTFIPLKLDIPEHHILTWDPAASDTPPSRPGKPGDHVRLDIKASQEMIVSGKFKNVLKKYGLDDVQVNVVPVAVAREHKFAIQTGEALKDAAARFAGERLEQGQDRQAVLAALGRWT